MGSTSLSEMPAYNKDDPQLKAALSEVKAIQDVTVVRSVHDFKQHEIVVVDGCERTWVSGKADS